MTWTEENRVTKVFERGFDWKWPNFVVFCDFIAGIGKDSFCHILKWVKWVKIRTNKINLHIFIKDSGFVEHLSKNNSQETKKYGNYHNKETQFLDVQLQASKCIVSFFRFTKCRKLSEKEKGWRSNKKKVKTLKTLNYAQK